MEFYFSLIASVRKDRKDAGKTIDQFNFSSDILEAEKGREESEPVQEPSVAPCEDYDIPDDESVEM